MTHKIKTAIQTNALWINARREDDTELAEFYDYQLKKYLETFTQEEKDNYYLELERTTQ